MSYPRYMVLFLGDDPENAVKLIHSATRTVLVVCSLILGIFGIPGNILAIRILRRRLMRENALSNYLIWLASANICCLLVEMSRYLIMGLLDYNYRQLNYEVCIIHRWSTIVVITICNWFLVTITMGRWLLLRYPVRSAALFRQWKVHVTIVGVIFLIAIGQGFMLLYQFDFDFTGSPAARKHFKKYACRLHTASFASIAIRTVIGLVPLVPLTVISFLIFYQVKKGSRGGSLYLPSSALKRRAVRERNLALLLLICNMQLIVTNLPLGIYYLTAHKFFNEDSRVGRAASELAAHVARMSLYGSYATNCIIYCFFGSRFRSELIKFLYENGICRKQIRRGSEVLVFGTQTTKDGGTTPIEPTQKCQSLDVTESSRPQQSDTADILTGGHMSSLDPSTSDDAGSALYRRMSTVDPVKTEFRLTHEVIN